MKSFIRFFETAASMIIPDRIEADGDIVYPTFIIQYESLCPFTIEVLRTDGWNVDLTVSSNGQLSYSLRRR